MASQDLSEDTLDDIVSRRVHGDCREVSLKSEVNSEGT